MEITEVIDKLTELRDEAHGNPVEVNISTCCCGGLLESIDHNRNNHGDVIQVWLETSS